MNRILYLIFSIGIISCTNVKSKSNQEVLCSNDTALIYAYKSILPMASESDKKFINQLLKTINNFCSKKLDTTLLTYCQLDCDDKLDTIKTRAFEDLGKIIVYSSWTRNGKLLWEVQVTDPYKWINENPLFDAEKSSKWVKFTIGIYYTAPDIYKIEECNDLRESAIGLGLTELEKNGFKVEKDLYRQYIENFKGNLVDWGHPENREGLYIWYEPLQKFVSFYHD